LKNENLNRLSINDKKSLEDIMNATKDIESLLPHRKPFLFVDEVVSAEDGKSVCLRTFNADEYFFEGHFPGNPIVPGAIISESLGQSGTAGLAAEGKFAKGTEFFLLELSKTKFLNPVRPGDTCRHEVEIVEMTQKIIKQRGKTYVGDVAVCESEWVVYYREPKKQ
jgi:3-hydroxyacyl-[acyl-carrier-protein] dehydratase